jgi:hypothetical protein
LAVPWYCQVMVYEALVHRNHSLRRPPASPPQPHQSASTDKGYENQCNDDNACCRIATNFVSIGLRTCK